MYRDLVYFLFGIIKLSVNSDIILLYENITHEGCWGIFKIPILTDFFKVAPNLISGKIQFKLKMNQVIHQPL